MARPQSPLVGYNTNVRHRGKLYHIQTEDSGVNHPHVITHLFADGGRIIASRKTSYAEYVGAEDLPNIVRKLMQEQHKRIFIQLRDRVFDEEDTAPAEDARSAESHTPDGQNGETRALDSALRLREKHDVASNASESDLSALDRAADQKAAGSAAARAQQAAASRGKGRYRQTVAAHGSSQPPAKGSRPTESIFGGQLLKGRSLDEVILSYLADDLSESDR